MKKSKILFVIFSFLTFIQACNRPEKANVSDENTAGKIFVISDFEHNADSSQFEGPVKLSLKFPAHGKHCAELSDTSGKSLYMETAAFTKDWSAYDYLRFDVYNPSDRLYYGTLQIFDEEGSDHDAEFSGQSYNGDRLFLNTGWNHFNFLLHHAMVEEGDRPIDLSRIRKMSFSFGQSETPLYVDNIRLVKGEESRRSRSVIKPEDCVILINDRYAYPSLAGPVEAIETSDRILHLRTEAEKSVEALKNDLKAAELQGFQTLYQRIPLITADVGLNIRSRLVWFQNEKEEGKILEYVISSCKAASKELTDRIVSRPTDKLTFAPEDEVNRASMYVPSYPPFEELKPGDGYYEDKSGRPVMVFSVLQVNQGPLMDYFAPFDHRLESYTVGGGSRYNIEDSPVYTAFHKYPGTHRVGWDGWCGHLIKDRWSMGGKKEDVVICLENEHIKKAVLDYMNRHYREWTGNPDLLYNIMAYELQYICFCDQSQGMFREWLKKKYGAIGTLNKAWSTSYDSFNTVEAPKTSNARPVDDTNRAEWYDWACFNNRRFTDYMKWIKQEMRRLDPETAICAGGTSSMLNSSNSVTGIDEELIINEVDDVILNESGSSPVYSDLLLSLSDSRKVMVDPEMGGDTHGILLQFLHGKADISKWWWAGSPSKEFPRMNETSLPHSKQIPLEELDNVLRLGLDIRRLSSEISAFTHEEPELAILYSKSSIIQVPPGQIQSGNTPYINTLYSAWKGARFLGCRTGFISEKQIRNGKLGIIKLLIVPAVKYTDPSVVEAVRRYVSNGGIALVIPESFIFDQYARQNDGLKDFGIRVEGVTLPPILGKGEKEQNYDQSFSQAILYGDVKKKITCKPENIFEDDTSLVTLMSNGLVQKIDPGKNQVLATFEDGNPAIILVRQGKGLLYYLAAPLTESSSSLLMEKLAPIAGLKRPVVGVDNKGHLITGAEIRSIERENDYLVYACNLTGEPVEFSLQGKILRELTDLRTMITLKTDQLTLKPYQETIYRIAKIFE